MLEWTAQVDLSVGRSGSGGGLNGCALIIAQGRHLVILFKYK